MPRRALRVRAVGTAPCRPERERDGLQEHLEVRPERLRQHVLDVQRDAPRIGDVVPARDLPQTGQARTHALHQRQVLPVVLRLPRHDWSWADEAHRAGEDGEELRELVQPGAPQEPPESRDARIAAKLEHVVEFVSELRARRQQRVETALGVGDHRAQLHAPEGNATQSESILRIERRPARRALHGEREQAEHRQPQRCGQHDDGHVEEAFAVIVPRLSERDPSVVRALEIVCETRGPRRSHAFDGLEINADLACHQIDGQFPGQRVDDAVRRRGECRVDLAGDVRRQAPCHRCPLSAPRARHRASQWKAHRRDRELPPRTIITVRRQYPRKVDVKRRTQNAQM